MAILLGHKRCRHIILAQMLFGIICLDPLSIKWLHVRRVYFLADATSWIALNVVLKFANVDSADLFVFIHALYPLFAHLLAI